MQRRKRMQQAVTAQHSRQEPMAELILQLQWAAACTYACTITFNADGTYTYTVKFNMMGQTYTESESGTYKVNGRQPYPVFWQRNNVWFH